MPLVRIVSSAVTPLSAEPLLRDLSALLARELGKPEAYVMTCLEPPAKMTFAGTAAPACYVEVKNVGSLSSELTKRLSAALTERLAAALGVEAGRIYIMFAEVRPHHWGWDGDTFG
jgi:phenylpyruvate tautomerase PptA (4-oxalocrotonate tautomerase family)